MLTHTIQYADNPIHAIPKTGRQLLKIRKGLVPPAMGSQVGAARNRKYWTFPTASLSHVSDYYANAGSERFVKMPISNTSSHGRMLLVLLTLGNNSLMALICTKISTWAREVHGIK